MTPKEMEMLESLADRLSEEPEFMAFVLEAYQKVEGISESDLEIKLGLTHVLFIQLKFCRRPSSTSPQKDLSQIAAFSGADEALLAQIINQVDFLSQPADGGRRASSSPQQLALAARKRDTLPPPEKPEGS